MKAHSGNLGNFFMTLLLLLIGVGLIYGSFINAEIGQHIANALQVPAIAAGLGAILILSVVLRWIGGCRRHKEAFINFDSDDGSVGISVRAICDFIERIGKEFSAIKHIDSKIIKGKGHIDISLGVKVVSGNKIPELSHVLQQRVRESVRESLGLDEIRNITIKVQEIVGEPSKHVADDALLSEE